MTILMFSDLISDMHILESSNPRQLRALLEFLGLMSKTIPSWAQQKVIVREGTKLIASTSVEQSLDTVSDLLLAWQNLRVRKMYAEADALKEQVGKLGVQFSMSKDGPLAEVKRSFDPDMMEALK